MKPTSTRRTFLKAGSLATGTLLASTAQARDGDANSRLGVGMIGCGGMATQHLRALLSMQDDERLELRWACDIYKERAVKFRDMVAAQDGKARTTANYEKVLNDKNVDYVVIATPEHSHYYLAEAALQAGKHVYLEKPMCYDVKDAKALTALANSTGLKLQIGVQGMSDDSYSSAYEAIRAGKIGNVVEAQIEYVRDHPADRGPWRSPSTDSEMEKPKDLDWERWVYPRAARPWNPHHYFEWRCYWDYSGGISTDLFVHRITRIIRACGLSFPDRAAGLGGIYTWDDGRDTPDSLEALFEYPEVPGVTRGMTVHVLGTMANQRSIDHCIRGEDGTIVFTRTGWERFEPRGSDPIETFKKTRGEDVVPHHKNHHAAIRDGAALRCPPEMGLYGVVAARMVNLSWKNRKMVQWDDSAQTVQTA